MKIISISTILLFANFLLMGQSFEVSPGINRIFLDAQFLKFFDQQSRISLFSRTRATTTYDGTKTDLFTGGYVNYSTASGVGGTVVGRISSTATGVDVGVHFFKAKRAFMVFALPSIQLQKDLFYSWFSILKFTPGINDNWKMYNSLELYSAFGSQGHLASVQRIRVGMDRKGYQFGLALEVLARRTSSGELDAGIFLRKQF